MAALRVAKGTISGVAAATLLTLVWLGVWVGGFSAAATKLPNYVLPAYPAAAFLVAIVAVDAARKAASGGWPHPRWMATGLASLVFGGAATAVTVPRFLGTLHWPRPLRPQQATVPSDLSATVWLPPAAIEVTVPRFAGMLHWP